MTILVVDNSPESLERLCRMLEHEHQVLTASDGAAGLRLAKIHQPDLILLDIHMPDLDGYEVLQRLKADEELKAIPVIVMSAWYDGIEIVIKSLELGAFDYLSKPIEPTILFTRLHMVSRMIQSEERSKHQRIELHQLNAALKKEIANHKWAEEELRSSEERYRIVSELTSDYAYAYAVDENGQLSLEWVTGALQRITGFTRGEIHARGGWESLIYPEDLPIPMQQLQALFANRSQTVEYRILTKSGDIKWMRDHARPVWDDHTGTLRGIYGAVQDITDLKQTG